MTREEIIAFGRSVGLKMITRGNYFFISHENLGQLLEAHAAAERNRTWTQSHWTEYEKAIAAAEREACAKVFDDRDNGIGFYEPHEPAEIIRARGLA